MGKKKECSGLKAWSIHDQLVSHSHITNKQCTYRLYLLVLYYLYCSSTRAIIDRQHNTFASDGLIDRSSIAATGKKL